MCIRDSSRDGVAEPDGHPAPLDRPQHRLPLVGVGHGLQGEHVRLRFDERRHPGPVEPLQLRHAQSIPPAVLAAVRQHRAVRADGRGDPDLVLHGAGRPPGQFHAPPQQRPRLGPPGPAPREPLVRGLVTGGDQHPRSRPHVRRVRRLDLPRVIGEEARRPQVVGEVAALRLQLVGQPAVEDERPTGEGRGERVGGSSDHEWSSGVVR